MTWADLVYTGLILFLGGCIKGYSGVGLPMVAIPALTLIFPAEYAVSLMIAPVLLANLIQARRLSPALLRNSWLGWLIFSLLTGITAGAVLIPVNCGFMMDMIGLSMILFSILSLSGYQLHMPSRLRQPLAIIFGGFAGIVGGSTSLYGWPLVIYTSSLRLPPNEFIAVIASLYLVGHLGFIAVLSSQDMLTLSNLSHSVFACLPVFSGIMLGRKLHSGNRHSSRFYQLLYLLMLAGGTGMLLKGN